MEGNFWQSLSPMSPTLGRELFLCMRYKMKVNYKCQNRMMKWQSTSLKAQIFQVIIQEADAPFMFFMFFIRKIKI